MVSNEKKQEIASWLLDPDARKHSKKTLGDLEHEIKLRGLEKVYREIELPLIPILDDMHDIGIKVDVSGLEGISKELERKLNSLEKSIYKKSGAEFNINSPKQLGEILFNKLNIVSEKIRKTKTGQISTNEEALQLIKNQHAVVPLILEYRELFKLKSTYTDPLGKLADKHGRIHTTFLQMGAATGRLASRNPNMQNIPASGEWAQKIRGAFVSEPGFTLAAFDYSQIELRILSTVSRDENMIQAFRDGKDIHAITAALVYGVKPGEVTKEMRRTAKTLNFGISYGMGATAFGKTSGLSLKDARDFIKKYFEMFPSIKKWQEETLTEARKNKYVENLNGRKRFLSYINNRHNPRLRAEAERIAINMPMQGLSADIIKLAMIKVSKELKKKGWWQRDVRLLLTIHDELIFEIKDMVLKEAMPIIRDLMVKTYKLAVPIEVHASSGKNWGSLR
jgi:DNA polymerase I